MEYAANSNTLPAGALRPATPVNYRRGYAGLNLEGARVNASLSNLDITAIVFAAVMALGPLAMAAWGANFGA